MAVRKRARADEAASRVNAAAEALAAGTAIPEAARRLADQFQISERQARRYLNEAQSSGTVPVPAPKVVLTVSVEQPLRQRVGAFASSAGRPVSDVVAQALSEFLDRNAAEPGGGTAGRR